MSPRVSVIIPAYNAAEFVAETIDSALVQTYRDFEVVVVDDGSTDATAEILATYGSAITVLQQPNGGPAAARNCALRAARGALVAPLDADDGWEDTFLALMVERLDRAPQTVVGVFAGWVAVDRSGNEIPNQRIVRGAPVDLRELALGNRFQPSAVLVRHAAIVDAGGFDEALPRGVEDWDLWLRLAAQGGEFVAVDRCLCRYRVYGESVSHRPDSMRAGRLGALEKLFGRADLPPEVRAVHPRALANAYLQSAVDMFANRRAADGERDFSLAVQSCPALLGEDELYYAAICATQSVGYKASRHGLDLDEGAARIGAALTRCVGDGAIPSGAAERRARGRALRALARLALGQRSMGAARRYAAMALLADPRLWSDWVTVGTLVKSFAGATAVEALSRWRRQRDTAGA
jgi:glycosyltransferase involved in cell wall biosynthesis